jgi:uncharacterized membrane protein YGL010W
MANTVFNRQLALYAAVHRDMRNRATHFVGIPIIVFALLLVLTLWRFEVVGREVTMAMVATVFAVVGWLVLDLGIGLALAVAMLAAWFAAEALAFALGRAGSLVAFVALFVGGWMIQFLGHHYEGKRPALMDNFFQSFIGPMFLVAELLIESGYRRDLANVIGEGDVTAQ